MCTCTIYVACACVTTCMRTLCKFARARDQGVCCEVLSPGNVRSYTNKVPPTWLPKHELDKANDSRHGKVDERKLRRPQPYKKKYRWLRKAGSREWPFPGKIKPIGYPKPNSNPWEYESHYIGWEGYVGEMLAMPFGGLAQGIQTRDTRTWSEWRRKTLSMRVACRQLSLFPDLSSGTKLTLPCEYFF